MMTPWSCHTSRDGSGSGPQAGSLRKLATCFVVVAGEGNQAREWNREENVVSDT